VSYKERMKHQKGWGINKIKNKGKLNGGVNKKEA
jgi:hypothetical protein